MTFNYCKRVFFLKKYITWVIDPIWSNKLTLIQLDEKKQHYESNLKRKVISITRGIYFLQKKTNDVSQSVIH